jgi:hypothetical protein
LTDHLQFHKKLTNNKRGFSTVVATIFMVLAIMFLFFNVFVFVQNQNSKLEDAASQSAQLDADRKSEQLTILSGSYVALSGGVIRITCTVINNSPIPVQLVRMWVQDYDNTPHSGSVSMSIAIQPGGRLNLVSFSVYMGTTITGSLRAWFVTSRGYSVLFLIN